MHMGILQIYVCVCLYMGLFINTGTQVDEHFVCAHVHIGVSMYLEYECAYAVDV